MGWCPKMPSPQVLQPAQDRFIASRFDDIERRLRLLERTEAGPVQWRAYTPTITVNGVTLSLPHRPVNDQISWCVWADLGAAIMVKGNFYFRDSSFYGWPFIGGTYLGEDLDGKYKISLPPRWHARQRTMDDMQVGTATVFGNPGVCFTEFGEDLITVSYTNGNTGVTGPAGPWHGVWVGPGGADVRVGLVFSLLLEAYHDPPEEEQPDG